MAIEAILKVLKSFVQRNDLNLETTYFKLTYKVLGFLLFGGFAFVGFTNVFSEPINCKFRQPEDSFVTSFCWQNSYIVLNATERCKSLHAYGVLLKMFFSFSVFPFLYEQLRHEFRIF